MQLTRRNKHTKTPRADGKHAERVNQQLALGQAAPAPHNNLASLRFGSPTITQGESKMARGTAACGSLGYCVSCTDYSLRERLPCHDFLPPCHRGTAKALDALPCVMTGWQHILSIINAHANLPRCHEGGAAALVRVRLAGVISPSRLAPRIARQGSRC